VFDSECFKANEEQLNAECGQMLNDWRQWIADHQQRPHHPHPEQPLPDPMPVDPQPGTPDENMPEPEPDHKEDDGDDSEEHHKDQHHQQSFYEACHDDKVALCPELPDDVSPHKFIKSKCAHQPTLSPKCHQFFAHWRQARMAVFGVLISTTFATMFGGLLACLAVCCCIACCVRSRRMRRMRHRSLNTNKAACAKLVPAKVINASDLESPMVFPINGEEGGMPMQTFPMSAAYQPYSAMPQYWQLQQYQQVPVVIETPANAPTKFAQ